MFQKENLIKRYIFLFADMAIVVISLILANIIRFGTLSMTLYDNLYLTVMLVEMFACVLGNRMFNLDKNTFDRGWFQEFLAVLKSELCIAVAAIFFLYIVQKSEDFSRLQMGYFLVIFFILDYFGHQLIKKAVVASYKNSHSFRQIMLVTSTDKVDDILEKFETTNNWYFSISYIVFVDAEKKGEVYKGIPVVANVDDMIDTANNLALDAVFLNIGYGHQKWVDIKMMLHEFQDMGVVVHVNIDALELDMTNKKVENLGFFKVVSYSNTMRDPAQLFLKRIIDIIGSLIGILLTFLVGLFVVPAIKRESKGPAIYSSVRVGKNGRHFKMYKFRSMCENAEEMKEQLLEKNEMQGAIFKMEDDPRITKVGRFIRKYSIDEMPQFFNVLKGDMSLVGTRPPTADEVEKYRTGQKRRLSVTPGITGLWQVSGRNEIKDFDEIVKLDLEYIDQWSIGLDIKLIFKTIGVALKGRGAK